MLSVIIIAKNEAHHIRRCLQSVAFADEIIVLDSGSSDDTVTIAREFTDQVYCTDWQGYGVQKQRALSYATKPWVLNLDADEFVSPELALEIQKLIGADEAAGYRIPIQMYFYQQPMRFSASTSRHIRLFKREGAAYSLDIVHEKICLPAEAKIGQCQASLYHHSFHDVSHALSKMNKYSSYSAKIRIKAGKQASLSRTLLASAWMFFRCYALQRGFLDGKAGFVLAVLNAQGAFYRGIKQIYPDSQLDKLPQVIE